MALHPAPNLERARRRLEAELGRLPDSVGASDPIVLRADDACTIARVLREYLADASYGRKRKRREGPPLARVLVLGLGR